MEKSFLGQWFGKLNIHLIAEHGAWYKYSDSEWQNMFDTEVFDQQWESNILPILEKYTSRCNGSFVEQKSISLAWHYRNVHPDLGHIRSQELHSELSKIISSEDNLQLLDGHKVL